MGAITIGIIIILNLIAIWILYKSLGEVEIKNKIAITAVCLIIMYVLIFIIYGISSIGLDKNIADASRQIILFTILPINVICIMSPILTQLRRLRDKDINEEKFFKRILIYAVIGIILLILEIMYIKNIQEGIASFKV